ncbi:MAG: hypothetical protein KDD70_04170 [Bdellovibrionales bacterium]|nr:hypothetical protein [Bdellovibrionales bacterium]
MKKLFVTLFVIVAYSSVAFPALAQKGAGDAVGLAKKGTQVELSQLTGEVLELVKGPCEKTTGCSKSGYHLRVKTDANPNLNLHLGALQAVEKITPGLGVGDKISFEAFRTDKLKAGDMIAKSLTYDGKTVNLRDSSLKPVWAAGGKQNKRGGGRGNQQG